MSVAHSLTPYGRLRGDIVSRIDAMAYRDALGMLTVLQSSQPTDALLLLDMATCYVGLSDTETALALLEMVAKLDAGDPQIWGRIGSVALMAGKDDTARDAFERQLKSTPGSVMALSALNRIGHFPRDSHKARLLRKIAQRRSAPRSERMMAWNALGRIEEAAGRYQIAFRSFAQSKALMTASHDPDAIARHVDDQIARFRPAAQSGASNQRMVFVTGMPRSGTTLVETILQRHPRAQTVGETPILSRVLGGWRERLAAAGHAGDWSWIDHTPPLTCKSLNEAFWTRMTQLMTDTSSPEIVIEKMPLNILELGFAQWILPDARFVFVSRHPLDVGLSIFSTLFAGQVGFSSSLEQIAAMTRDVYRAAEDYEAKLGTAFRWQSYRALVTAPEREIRALVAHTGLDWDPACLDQNSAAPLVRTASVSQVRQPIHQTRLDRWKRYEAELQPLVAALGPDWLARWETRDAACQP